MRARRFSTKCTGPQSLLRLLVVAGGMQQAPVQVTVVEYVNEFFKNYFRRAYGKSLAVNAGKGAETLMGEWPGVLLAHREDPALPGCLGRNRTGTCST